MPHSRGEHRPTSKLKEDQVRAIIRSPEKCCVLAVEYGVSIPNISMIKRGLRWKYLYNEFVGE